MQRYLALLRGVNVGGNSIIHMSDLRQQLVSAGFANVSTYIQSGNVLFDTDGQETLALAARIQEIIQHAFHINIGSAIFTHAQWQAVIAGAPAWWGNDPERKHNLLVLIPPYDMNTVAQSIGALKPDVEAIVPGEGVLYQSMSRSLTGRTTTSKLANSPVYQQITIRNYNTAQKLLTLF